MKAGGFHYHVVELGPGILFILKGSQFSLPQCVHPIHKWLLELLAGQQSSFILIPQIQTIYSHSSDKNSTFTLGHLTSGYHLPASSLMLFIKTLVTPPHLSGTLALWSFDFLLPFSKPISRSMQTTCTNNFFFFCLSVFFLSILPSLSCLLLTCVCLNRKGLLIHSLEPKCVSCSTCQGKHTA